MPICNHWIQSWKVTLQGSSQLEQMFPVNSTVLVSRIGRWDAASLPQWQWDNMVFYQSAVDMWFWQQQPWCKAVQFSHGHRPWMDENSRRPVSDELAVRVTGASLSHEDTNLPKQSLSLSHWLIVYTDSIDYWIFPLSS